MKEPTKQESDLYLDLIERISKLETCIEVVAKESKLYMTMSSALAKETAGAFESADQLIAEIRQNIAMLETRIEQLESLQETGCNG